MTPQQRIEQLEKSHDQLRGAVVAAGFHLRKFRRDSKNEKILQLLRNVLHQARAVRKTEIVNRQTA